MGSFPARRDAVSRFQAPAGMAVKTLFLGPLFLRPALHAKKGND